MSDNKPNSQGSSFSNTGSMSGNIVNTGSTLTGVIQQIGGMPNATADDKQTLTELLNQLQTVLTEAKTQAPDQANAIATVERRAKELVEEAVVDAPDKAEVAERGDKLKKAAENIGKAAPTVFVVVTQVVDFIGKLLSR